MSLETEFSRLVNVPSPGCGIMYLTVLTLDIVSRHFLSQMLEELMCKCPTGPVVSHLHVNTESPGPELSGTSSGLKQSTVSLCCTKLVCLVEMAVTVNRSRTGDPRPPRW